jgi:hypothetical protein
MGHELDDVNKLDRRGFLAGSGGVVAGLVVAGMPGAGPIRGARMQPGQEPLPTIPLGTHRVTRLVAGYNPIGGHSHTTLAMARHMRDYFTAEQTAEFVLDCERKGINTWQYDPTDKTLDALRLARNRGSRIQLICLIAERSIDPPIDQVLEQSPIAIVHHGGATDTLFKAGKARQVHDFVKKVHDRGVLAGVSSHNPAVVKQIADEGWEVDLFMTCFYFVSRSREEMVKELGKVPVGEPFLESDPDDMTRVVRQVKQPCLGFKILAAGRLCWTPSSVEAAFKYAFSHIKSTDALLVGMYPRFRDEVGENVGYTRKYGRAVETGTGS